ncbi:hypothetical protein PHLGIDRAFT_78753 [Phlebiopsis gigantea 11061_1 CR5-6]|uniref:Cytochrome P450 n=1 Tax=Phlebiopsis gigantea (strain 11061_1 CR5-6) TaxID=745531 RepID=A0A0C3RRH3_PHLG1|nr:hypothetical protein PHLGIDRAFT_78753 [Phlebiopsis gigantea 11061_1 CR5-6]
MDNIYTLYLIFAVLLTLAIARIQKRKDRFPPGPPGLPVVGNLFNSPKGHSWLAYQSWSTLYGSDIIHFKLFSNHVFVVSSSTVAKELFEKRSNIYSDRHQKVMVHELTGWDRNLALMSYSERWRTHRRHFHQYFRPDAVPAYHPCITTEVHKLLAAALDAPNDCIKHFRYMAGSATLNIVYAIETQPEDDPILIVAERGAQCLSEIVNAGSFLVDSVPALKYVPGWFPGAGWKKQAAVWREQVDALHFRPFEIAKAAYDSGNAKPCITTSLLDGLNKSADKKEYEQMVINVTALAYQAGTDTTVTSLTTLVLAMLFYPEVQAAARAEIDRVVGCDRLPELGDKESLPYITAVTKEVLRWHPALPLAVPHRTIEDDEYQGYFIPKGSLVIGNTWAILRDPSRYANPEMFNPSRFLTSEGTLDPDVPDPTEGFGYGRRICVGRHFAMDIMWLTVANVLAVFEINESVDAFGRVVKAREEYTTGLFSAPKDMKATFKPRSAAAVKLIRSVVAES